MALTFLLLIALPQAFATSDTWLCSHYQICNLLESCLKDTPAAKKPTLDLLQVGMDTHHEQGPTPGALKKLSQANKIIVGPYALHPWLKKYLKQDKKNQDQILQLEIKNNPDELNLEAKAHFWLYPELLKDIAQQLKTAMAQWGYACSLDKNISSLEVPNLKKIKVVVLGHGALESFFGDKGLQSLVLSAHGHHSEITPEVIKKLYQLRSLNLGPFLWVWDQGVTSNGQIKKLVKEGDQQITLDLEGRPGTSITTPLQELIQKLKILEGEN